MDKKITVVCIVLNNFKNDNRVLKEARSLQNHGYDVLVVALHENSLAEHEIIENFRVHRIRIRTKCWPKYKLIQMIKYFEFIWKAVKLYKRADIVHCNDLSALPVGVIIKKFFNKNVKIVYDAHEYETERNGLVGIQKKLHQRLESLLIDHADQVMTVSDSIANEYARLYGIAKPSLVLNCPQYVTHSKQNKFREKLEIKNDQIIFLYQGGLIRGRGCELLINAFSGFDSDKNVIVFMGYGPIEHTIKTYVKKFPNIYFHPPVSPDVLLTYTSSADYGISFVEDTCLSYRYCLPNKIFEYFMADLPVISSNLFEMKRLVQKYQVGVVSCENTIHGLQQAINEILDLDYEQLVRNVRKAKDVFNWEAQEKVLLSLYNALN